MFVNKHVNLSITLSCILNIDYIIMISYINFFTIGVIDNRWTENKLLFGKIAVIFQSISLVLVCLQKVS